VDNSEDCYAPRLGEGQQGSNSAESSEIGGTKSRRWKNTSFLIIALGSEGAAHRGLQNLTLTEGP